MLELRQYYPTGFPQAKETPNHETVRSFDRAFPYSNHTGTSRGRADFNGTDTSATAGDTSRFLDNAVKLYRNVIAFAATSTKIVDSEFLQELRELASLSGHSRCQTEGEAGRGEFYREAGTSFD